MCVCKEGRKENIVQCVSLQSPSFFVILLHPDVISFMPLHVAFISGYNSTKKLGGGNPKRHTVLYISTLDLGGGRESFFYSLKA